MNIRAFTAVEVWPEIRQRARALIDRFKDTTAKVTWLKPDQMHLTMNFLGDVPLNDVPAVCKAVAQAAQPFVEEGAEAAGDRVAGFPAAVGGVSCQSGSVALILRHGRLRGVADAHQQHRGQHDAAQEQQR